MRDLFVFSHAKEPYSYSCLWSYSCNSRNRVPLQQRSHRLHPSSQPLQQLQPVMDGERREMDGRMMVRWGIGLRRRDLQSILNHKQVPPFETSMKPKQFWWISVPWNVKDLRYDFEIINTEINIVHCSPCSSSVGRSQVCSKCSSCRERSEKGGDGCEKWSKEEGTIKFSQVSSLGRLMFPRW